MADSISAIEGSPGLLKLADFLRYLQEGDKVQPTTPVTILSNLLLPKASTIENLAYGNYPIAMPPSGTGGYVPVVKTGRKGEVADILATATGGIPGSKAVSSSANRLGDIAVQAITRNPEATAPAVIEYGQRMMPLSQIFIGPKSSAWDKAAAATASELEKAGTSAEDIFKQTGTFRGLDKQWRQEISDIGATLDMSKVPVRKNVQDFMDEIIARQGIQIDPKIPLGTQLGTERYNQIYDLALNQFKNQQSTVRLPTAFRHPTLEEAYPNLIGNLRIGKETEFGVRGHFQPSTKTVTTGGYEREGMTDLEKADQARSTLLHEIQHAIQHHEVWAMGGSPGSARDIMNAVRLEEKAPYVKPNAQWEAGYQMFANAGKAQTYQKLSDLMVKENIKPRQITSMSPFYEYSDLIRSKYGPMPKKAGPDRDNWLQNAAAEIKQKLLERDSTYELYGKGYTKQEAKNLERRGFRLMGKHQESVRKLREIENKFKKLKEMPDEELYRRLAGEAESRLTQTREGLSDELRRINYPLAEQQEGIYYGTSLAPKYEKYTKNRYGLDVPRAETISYRPFSQSYSDDPLHQFLGITPTESGYDPLLMFVGQLGK